MDIVSSQSSPRQAEDFTRLDQQFPTRGDAIPPVMPKDSREDLIARKGALMDHIRRIRGVDQDLIAQMLPHKAYQMPNVRFILPNEPILIFHLHTTQACCSIPRLHQRQWTPDAIGQAIGVFVAAE